MADKIERLGKFMEAVENETKSFYGVSNPNPILIAEEFLSTVKKLTADEINEAEYIKLWVKE